MACIARTPQRSGATARIVGAKGPRQSAGTRANTALKNFPELVGYGEFSCSIGALDR